MDAVGFALNVIALPSTVDSCLNLYKRLSTARHYNNDFEDLSLLLKIEGTRFSRLWDKLGAQIPPDESPPLSSPAQGTDNGKRSDLDTASTSKETNVNGKGLKNCIRMTVVAIERNLKEAECLVEKRTSDAKESVVTHDVGPAPEGLSKKKFGNLFQRSQEPTTTLPGKRRLSWVVKDKDRFAELVDFLNRHNNNLQELIPHTRAQIQMDVSSISLSSQDRSQLQKISSSCRRSEYRTIGNNAAAKVISLDLKEVRSSF